MEFLSVDYFVTDVDKSLIACFISVDFKKPSAMNKPSEDNHTQSFMDLLNFSSVTYFCSTSCPPKPLRKAATTLPVIVSSCNERWRIIRDKAITGAGTPKSKLSSMVHFPSPEDCTRPIIWSSLGSLKIDLVQAPSTSFG